MSEISKDKLREVFAVILKDFKALDTELLVHQTVIRALRVQFSDIDKSLEITRKNPDVLQAIDRKYDKILESWNKQLDRMKSVSEFFQEWKPQGPIN